jgi:hypothetical protein
MMTRVLLTTFTVQMFKTACFASVFVLLFAVTSRAELVAHYQFNGNFDDASGFGNHGTAQNGASLSNDTPPTLSLGQSLLLGDGQQHVLVPHDTSLDITETMTVTAWIKTDGNAWEGLLAKSPSDGSGANHAGNYEIRVENGTNQLHFLYQKGGVNDTEFPISDTPEAVVVPGQWTHIAVTVEQIGAAPGQVIYYQNGVLADGDNLPILEGFGATNTNPLYIGSRADLFTQFNGSIDDLRIYNHVLTEAEIAATMSQIPEPSALALAALGLLALLGFARRRRR